MPSIRMHFDRVELGQLPGVLAAVEDAALRWKLPDSLVPKAQLLMEELVVNVVEHAYAGESGPLDVTVEGIELGLRFTLEDWSGAFNPLEQPPPDVRSNFEAGVPGGVGLVLVRKMANAVAYERRNGRNVVVVEVRQG